MIVLCQKQSLRENSTIKDTATILSTTGACCTNDKKLIESITLTEKIFFCINGLWEQMTPSCGQIRPQGQSWQDIRSVWGRCVYEGGGAIANMHCYILDNYYKMWVS